MSLAMRMWQRLSFGLLPSLAAVVLTGALMAGCQHKDIDVTYENRTSTDLFGDINGGGFEEIKAGHTRTLSHRLSQDKRDDIEITVKTEDGDIVYHEVFSSRTELEEATGKRIILEEPLPTVPSQR